MSRNVVPAIAGLVLLVAAAALVLQRAAISRARAENALLTEQAANKTVSPGPGPAQPAHSISSDAKWASDVAELQSLRQERIELNQQMTELSARAQAIAAAAAAAAAAKTAQQSKDALESLALIRTADAKDAGQATPADLIQTFLWAVTHGDTNRILQLMTFDSSADPQKMQAFVDKFTRALAEAPSPGGPVAVRIVGEVPADGNDRWISTQESREEGQWQEPERVLFRLTDSGWKLLIGTNGEPVSIRNN